MNMEKTESKLKCELYHDNFQNYKRYNIKQAQLVIADIPYNLANNAYASSPEWYIGGDNKNGESKKANSAFFETDKNFNINEFFHFSHKLLKPEPKQRNEAGCMVVFCSFQQLPMVIEVAKKHGFKNHIPLIFIKKTSAQVLKANMRIVGACEYGLVLYRDKLPKFRNNKKMILNWFEYAKDKGVAKIHPVQKPMNLLGRLIEIYTDPWDVVIDPCAGSGTTLKAAYNLGRNSYGFEVSKKFYDLAQANMLSNLTPNEFTQRIIDEQISKRNQNF